MITVEDEAEAARERYRDALERSVRMTAERTPERFRGARLGNAEVAEWVSDIRDEAIRRAGPNGLPAVTCGPSLLLCGPTGTGKTSLAYAAMARLGELGIIADWRAVLAADLYAALRPRHGVDSEQVFAEHAGARILLVDDLTAAKASEWTEEVNGRLIDRRYAGLMPAVFTANAMPKHLPVLLGERIASRLVQMCRIVVLDGPDYRIPVVTP